MTSQDARQTLPEAARYSSQYQRARFDTRSGIQITNGGGAVSRRAIPISSSQSRDPIARAYIALPELNGDRVRNRVCEHHPIRPAASVHLSIKSDHNYTPYSDTVGQPKRIHCHASCRPRPSPLLIYEISCTHHEFPTGARTRVSRQSRHALNQMSIIKRS